jgi:hypothetical protein
LAEYILYTPCADERYKLCGNYKVNEFENQMCMGCSKRYEYHKKFIDMGYDWVFDGDVDKLKDNYILSSNPLS